MASTDLHSVGSALRFDVQEPTVLALQVAPATTAGTITEERFEVQVDGRPSTTATTEVATAHGGRVHLVEVAAGMLDIVYEANLRAAAPAGPTPASVWDDEALTGLRQSRYCPSDELAGFAAREFDGSADADGIAAWVFERLRYTPGVSTPLHTAIDTLLAAEGVCRDFAHLTIALCRASGIPARLVAVYAPGLTPMDFHAVVEVRDPDGWRIVDPTRLAPRPTLVRIATGRDAADTAFASTISGDVELITAEVWATTDGDLPVDDHRRPMSLS